MGVPFFYTAAPQENIIAGLAQSFVVALVAMKRFVTVFAAQAIVSLLAS